MDTNLKKNDSKTKLDSIQSILGSLPERYQNKWHTPIEILDIYNKLSSTNVRTWRMNDQCGITPTIRLEYQYFKKLTIYIGLKLLSFDNYTCAHTRFYLQ